MFKKHDFEIFYLWTFEIIQKFSQKMKNFKNFFHVRVDTSVIVNYIKKNFKNIYFLAKFFSWSTDAHCDEKYLYWKIFWLQRKIDDAKLEYVSVRVQKLVFSSKLTIELVKTNFWTQTPTHLKGAPSIFLCKQKILQ